MRYAIWFGAGVLLGLILNWRSWKALSVFVDIAAANKQSYDTMKEAYDEMVRVYDLQKANTEKLWKTLDDLDPTGTYKRPGDNEIRH